MNIENTNYNAVRELALAQEFRDERSVTRILTYLDDDERQLFARLLLAANGEISDSPSEVYREILDIAAARYARWAIEDEYLGQDGA